MTPLEGFVAQRRQQLQMNQDGLTVGGGINRGRRHLDIPRAARILTGNALPWQSAHNTAQTTLRGFAWPTWVS